MFNVCDTYVQFEENNFKKTRLFQLLFLIKILLPLLNLKKRLFQLRFLYFHQRKNIFFKSSTMRKEGQTTKNRGMKLKMALCKFQCYKYFN